MQIVPNSAIATVIVTEPGSMVVELVGIDGKRYYHGRGLIPGAQAVRLAAQVNAAGEINETLWGCYEDEQAERQAYHESGEAAFDEMQAEHTYEQDCRLTEQMILRAEHNDPCWDI